jgi:molybdenum cofactor cytidylyltransferase
MTQIAAIIPAAGRSTRMGTAKALLDADGRSFLERVTGALSGGGCSPVFVVVEELRSPIAAIARTAGCTPLHNPDPSEGPISSIRVALDAMPPGIEGFMVCPVDHPLVRSETVAALIARFRQTLPPLVVPTLDGERGHPVLFRRDLAAELGEAGLAEGARTVVMRHLDSAAFVPVEDRGVRIDIDTIPEYRRHFPASWRRRFHAR